MEREMNFWDLCVACGRAITRGVKALGCLLARMTRLTYRYAWLVLPLLALAIAASFYYSRPGNRTYRVNAIALLNGPTVQQFEQAFASLCKEQIWPEATAFTTYRVIDCLHHETADFVDFDRKVKLTDTTKVVMHDRLCVQFRIKNCDMELLPHIEQAFLARLNADEAMQISFAVYQANLREEAAFNHAQAFKLDSLTSAYYFYTAQPVQPVQYSGNGMNFYGDRRVRLFLDELYEQRAHMQRVDYRLQLATAPVTLENHFAVDAKPINGRMKCLVLFFLIGWCIACLLAELIDQRKALSAWLKA